MQVAGVPKGRKAANHCVFPMICGSGAGKIGPLAKAAGAETSGQMRDEKLNAACSDHFWKLRCRKSARRCGTKHISKSKVQRTDGFGPLLEVEMSKKCALLWHEAHVEVKSAKHWRSRTTFGRSDVVLHGRHNGLCTLLKVSNEGFAAVSKRMAGVGQVKRICKDAFRVAGAVQETDESDMLGGQGADFLRGVAFWSIESSSLLRWFYVTGAALRVTWHHFFGGRPNTLDRWNGKIAKRVGTRPSALHSTFHFWRKSRRIASFLMLSTSKIEEVSQILSLVTLSSSTSEEVSQNCCASDVAKFKNWGSLAE